MRYNEYEMHYSIKGGVILSGKLGLTETEYMIMCYIWKEDLQMFSGKMIREYFNQQGQNWASQTVNTFLMKLIEKGALRYRLQGHQKVYSPAMSHELYKSYWLKQAILENFENGMDDLDAALSNFNQV